MAYVPDTGLGNLSWRLPRYTDKDRQEIADRRYKEYVEFVRGMDAEPYDMATLRVKFSEYFAPRNPANSFERILNEKLYKSTNSIVPITNLIEAKWYKFYKDTYLPLMKSENKAPLPFPDFVKEAHDFEGKFNVMITKSAQEVLKNVFLKKSII